MRVNKLPFKMGFEMTGIPIDHKEEDIFSLSDIMESWSRIISRRIQKAFPKYSICSGYTDGHCMEFQSPVFSSLQRVKRFYDIVMGHFLFFGIEPHHPDTVCGGNHFHFDVTGEHGRAIMRDMTQRPEIGWVFLQPDDIDSGNTLTKDCEFFESVCADVFSRNNFYSHWIKMLFTQEDFDRNCVETKDFAVSFNNGGRTIEFRCFEAPQDWDEFRDQLDFLIAYLFYTQKRIKEIKPLKTLMTNKELRAIAQPQAIQRFNNLLDELKLPRKRYAKYVNRNLKPRWEMKRKRY